MLSLLFDNILSGILRHIWAIICSVFLVFVTYFWAWDRGADAYKYECLVASQKEKAAIQKKMFKYRKGIELNLQQQRDTIQDEISNYTPEVLDSN